MSAYEAPRNLVVTEDGRITLADGSDPTEYLKKWMKSQKIKADTPVSICTSDSYQKLLNVYNSGDWRFAMCA
mgnify:CR=1 FL=1